MQQRVILRACHAAAAGRDHAAGALSQLLQCLRFQASEGRFAALRENFRDGAARRGLHGRVRVQKLPSQPLRQQPPDHALAAAGHSDQHDVLHGQRCFFRDLRDPTVRDGSAGKQLAAAGRLRHEHFQPARVRNGAPLRLEQERRPRGIVYHVQHERAVRKALQCDRRSAVVGIHSQRRCVDQNLRVRMALQIFVIILAAARDLHDLRPHPPQHVAGRPGGAAASEHQCLPALHRNAAVQNHLRKAENVGVVPEERSVRAADDGIDAADAPRRLGKLRAEGHDGFFVRDRDVQSVKVSAGQEAFHLFRRFFAEAVLVIAEHGVDRRRIAVSQPSAQKSAPEHHITSL